MTSVHFPYIHLSTEELWDKAAIILTELSHRDNVEYRVKPTEVSLKEKLEKL